MLLELEQAVDQAMPPQGVRLFDVWILGPFLLYLSLKKTPLSSLEIAALQAIATGTVLYNLVQYSGERQRQAEAAAALAPPAELPA
jgi:hypothetical protein